jgi:Domain of unknown function (DUF4178)
MSSTLVSPPLVKAKSLSCPNCGAPIELRGFAHTLSAVCPSCLSILDASSPDLQILQTYQGRQRVEPKIPLGSRGTLNNTVYELIGFQQRSVQTADDSFSWDEYLLFNPYKGFRYISEYQGHWNVIRVQSRVPQRTAARGRQAWRLDGRTFAAFDAMRATTSYVIGEFPWQVRRGETADCEDFIAPPYMLSSETTAGETTWSLGEYWTGTQIGQTFKLTGPPPYAVGIFANQPSPYAGKASAAWRMWLWFNVALFTLMTVFNLTKSNKQVFRDDYVYASYKSNDSAFVTPTFELAGANKNVEVRVHADIRNNWIYLSMALINDETGQTFDFAREVSYYVDSDGSEGSRDNKVVIPSVPAGRYYLRVEPEMSTGAPSTRYQISVRRDVPIYSYFWIAAALLLIPPIATWFRSTQFESRRWRESDYSPITSPAMKIAGGIIESLGDD